MVTPTTPPTIYGYSQGSSKRYDGKNKECRPCRTALQYLVTRIYFAVANTPPVQARRAFTVISDSSPSNLVVGAVGARHELSELLVGREPRLQVVLLDSRVVQLAGHDVHDPVGDAEALVELLGGLALNNKKQRVVQQQQQQNAGTSLKKGQRNSNGQL